MPKETQAVTLDRDNQPDMLPLMEGLAELFGTDELQKAVRALADSKPDAAVVCQRALRDTLDLLSQGSRLDKSADFQLLHREVAAIRSKLDSVLEKRADAELEEFLVPGTLSGRYRNEHAAEKIAASQYVVRTFFSEAEPIHWFVQGSVTAMHLAQALAKKRFAVGSLIHTNSIVLPLLILSEQSDVDVRPFSGSHYDPMCGGWLPRRDDTEARDHLEDLFRRQQDPLTVSIITPLAASAEDGTLFFTRSELIALLERLVQFSQHVVLMAFDSRIFRDLNSAVRYFTHTALIPFITQAVNPNVKVDFVVAADTKSPLEASQAAKYIQAFTRVGFTVHWQSPDLNWKVHPAAKP